MVIADLTATLLGLAAMLSALGGIVTTVLAWRKSHDEEREQCLQRLKATREESEKLAAELHELRMRDAT